MSKDYFKTQCKQIKKYLAGERTNPLICTTPCIAIKLQRKFNIDMKIEFAVNADLGLYMFKILN